MEGDVCCATLKEGSIEMVLQISRGVSGHYVRGIGRGDERRGEKGRDHLSG